MEDNKTKGTIDTTEEPENTGKETTNDDDILSISKSDLDKRIQSETDKIRTKYVEKIKSLETRIKELTPPKKSDEELDFEKRLASLEAREKKMALSDALNKKGISNELSDFLRDDADVDALSSVIEGMINKKLKTDSYTPGGHKSGERLTKEDFRRLSMDERERLYLESPELFKALAGR